MSNPIVPARHCRICGCTDSDCSACITAQGYPCHWVAPDLCSRCADRFRPPPAGRLITIACLLDAEPPSKET